MRIYGPVPSRRFGLSLGVDIVPHKTCPLDCIYCQLGATDKLSVTQENFYSIDEIITDVKNALDEGPIPDVITLAGSGEPALYASLEELIIRLKELSDVPVLFITNGVLLTEKKIRAAALAADIFAPSLDAGDEQTFEEINHPHSDIDFKEVISALKKTTHMHQGEIRLEVMLIKDINDDRESIQRIANIVETLRVDRIDLNTPVRPPVPERGALPCNENVLDMAKTIFGPRAFPIAKFEKRGSNENTKIRSFDDMDKDVRETLLRRPCSIKDIMDSIGLSESDAEQTLNRLLDAGLICEENSSETTYYRSVSLNPTTRRI